MRWLPLALAVALAGFASTASAKDYASTAYSILPPGNGGTLPTGPNSLDQLPLYDGLTPKFGSVGASDLRKFFKPNRLGTARQGPTKTEKTTNRRVKIEVDRWGVPHIRAKRRADVMFGAGWMNAKERALLLEIARGPGRLTILDPPGIDAFSLVTSIRIFEPSAQADAIVRRQVKLLKKRGPQRKKRRQLLRDIDAYIKGINAQYESVDSPAKPWTRTDFIAVAGFIGSIFGRGGGDEARRSMFLSALQDRLGVDTGRRVWNDLREYKDAESSTSIEKTFDYGGIPKRSPASRPLDDGSFVSSGPASAGRTARREMSNALLTSAERSAAGRPVFVAGPQLGYYYPEIVYEMDLRGGGIDARGIGSPGAGPYIFIGRGEDFSWSLTSAGNDIVDTYVETLCDGSDTKYLHKGECRDMTSVDAGVLKGAGDQPDERIRWNETVHGPVIGYATVEGQRVAVSRKRSTRGREILSVLAFQDLNTKRVRSANDFLETMPQLEHTFNAHYADSKDIAFITTGRLPVRPSNADPGLPVEGTGGSEWRGFISDREHAQQINPKQRGVILNWNNRPAPGWGAADDTWNYGPIHRNELFRDPIEDRARHRPHTVTSAMNRAATQDLRAEKVMFAVERVLEAGTAPSPRSAQMLQIVQDWRAQGSSRLDRDLDGEIDHGGAAIMDAWWSRLAGTVLGGVLTGDLLDRLDDLHGRHSLSFSSPWYGWVDKDLRTILGRKVRDKYSLRYCGKGDLATCSAALWASLEATGAALAEEQGADPAGWRASTAGERITFRPGLIDNTMRWTNRPTYQQVMQFKGEAR